MCEYLKSWVGFGEGSSKLCDTFSVPSKNAILNVLQREYLSSNQVAHIIEELQNSSKHS